MAMTQRIQRRALGCVVVLLVTMGAAHSHAWGVQGHRLVALVATAHLSTGARADVRWLLGDETLADVSSWADTIVADQNQTGLWHYVNMPAEATAYSRDRDCPRQAGVQPGARNDKWRDCVVDRIQYHEEQLKDRRLDRADRAIALKFLVHFVGDLHQPLHAVGLARGGNGIPVIVFGSPNCQLPDRPPVPCNLHGVWDSSLIAHRQLTDRQYVAELSRQIRANRWNQSPVGSAADWAMESFNLAKPAILAPQGAVDEAYYRAQIAVVDQRLAIGGIRLAALLNRALTGRN